MSTRTVPGLRSAGDGSRDELERVVVRQGSEDDVDGGGQFGGARRDGRAACCDGLRPRAAPVVNHELVAGVEEALCDRAAHVAKPDQPNLRTRVLTGAHRSV